MAFPASTLVRLAGGVPAMSSGMGHKNVAEFGSFGPEIPIRAPAKRERSCTAARSPELNEEEAGPSSLTAKRASVKPTLSGKVAVLFCTLALTVGFSVSVLPSRR